MMLIGDVHARVEDLGECERLADFIVDAIKKHQPKKVVFLGDTHHNHAVVRVEVIDFWRRTFSRINDVLPMGGFRPIVLVGNHDMSTATKAHALQSYSDLIIAVDEPMGMFGALCMPYYENGEDFVEACLGREEKVIICHQTFQGASYDNGFFAGDGIDLNLLPQKLVISGHIHTQQRIGSKCWYPGSPRWMTLGDANVEKAVWMVSLDEATGIVVSTLPLDTNEICRSIRTLVESPESLVTEKFQSNADYTVDLYGPAAWIEERLAYWRGKARVRTFPEATNTITVRESEGIGTAFGKYLDAFSPKFGTDKEVLRKLTQERIHGL